MSDYFSRIYIGPQKSVDRVLTQLFSDVGYVKLSRLLDKRDVFVDGRRVGHKCMVGDGQTVRLYFSPDMVRPQIVYETQDVVIVYKPKGVVTQGPYSLEGLVHYSMGDYYLAHRLDTNTDGLVLFAKNESAYAVVYDAMRCGHIVKYYRAVVWGTAQPGVLSGWLQKDADNARVRIYNSAVADAVAVECRVLDVQSQGETSVVNIELHGGKTHQLRAQLAHCGHFILGDSKYGDDRINRRLGYKKQQLTAYRMVYRGQEGLASFDVSLNTNIE